MEKIVPVPPTVWTLNIIFEKFLSFLLTYASEEPRSSLLAVDKPPSDYVRLVWTVPYQFIRRMSLITSIS